MSIDETMHDRLAGIAVGAAIGNALGMPLEFGPASPPDRFVRDMRPGRLPAGAFTDDTELALALAPCNPANLTELWAQISQTPGRSRPDA